MLGPHFQIGYDRATEYQPNNNNNHQLPDLVEVIEDSPSSSGSDTEDTDSDVQCMSRPAPVFGVITVSFSVCMLPTWPYREFQP